MKPSTTFVFHPLVLAAAAAGLVGLGAASMWVVTRPPMSSTTAGEASPAPVPAPADRQGAGDSRVPAGAEVTLTLPEEIVRRAQVTTVRVGRGTATGAVLEVPGVIGPDGYATVVVTPLTGGRVMEVTASLGDRVRRGDVLARVFSPELAEAQARYMSDRAALEAHEQEVTRTIALVQIGAASREEGERVHAAHAAHLAAVALAASRLELLGWSPAAIDALRPSSPVTSVMDVPAPINGVLTGRSANVGLNVEPATALFTVVDLARVWVIGQVYEPDIARVRVGMPAIVRPSAFPDRRLAGRVTYIDPTVTPETRTASIRVELPNTDRTLRLGMLATLHLGQPEVSADIVVPARAVQQIGDRTVVYVTDPTRPGTYIERQVELGAGGGDTRPVMAGLSVGDEVVVDGSFLLRAERERLGPTPAPRPATAPASGPQRPRPDAGGGDAPQQARIVVTERGFEPARVMLRAGGAARLTFVRTTDATCATEVVIPALDLRRPLPLDTEVAILLPARDAGEITFACGMDMLRGTLVVQ